MIIEMIIEKIVEKIVEKIIEKIIEKIVKMHVNPISSKNLVFHMHVKRPNVGQVSSCLTNRNMSRHTKTRNFAVQCHPLHDHQKKIECYHTNFHVAFKTKKVKKSPVFYLLIYFWKKERQLVLVHDLYDNTFFSSLSVMYRIRCTVSIGS